MNNIPRFLMGAGFSIMPVFVVYIILYYSALYKFIAAVKIEYPITWQSFVSSKLIIQPSPIQIGYQILRAISTKQINVEGNTKTFATAAWRYQNIGGAIFVIALLFLLVGKTLTQIR